MSDPRSGVNWGSGDRKNIAAGPGEAAAFEGEYVDALTQDLLATGQEVFHRALMNTNTIAMTTQLLRLSYFTARRTETVTQARVGLGAVAAAATPTLVRIGLWTSQANGALLALVASTANDTALLGGTINTTATKAFSASYQVQAGQRYALGLLVVSGTTVPQMAGIGLGFSAPDADQSPRLAAFVNAQADLPASVAVGSLSSSGARIYGVVLP